MLPARQSDLFFLSRSSIICVLDLKDLTIFSSLLSSSFLTVQSFLQMDQIEIYLILIFCRIPGKVLLLLCACI